LNLTLSSKKRAMTSLKIALGVVLLCLFYGIGSYFVRQYCYDHRLAVPLLAQDRLPDWSLIFFIVPFILRSSFGNVIGLLAGIFLQVFFVAQVIQFVRDYLRTPDALK
jgi:hypothetical protein